MDSPKDHGEAEPPAGKVCFVTTGATAPFTALIEAVLSPTSLSALLDAGYSHLYIQFGSAKRVYEDARQAAVSRLEAEQKSGRLTIGGTDFRSDGLKEDFRMVQESNGLVISHAGSGSILEALRYQVPLIVVPNTALLDNHQEDLAIAMERANYLLRGDVNNLTPAIRKAEVFRKKMAQFPPPTSGKLRETKSFAAIMDEMMGFE